MIVKVYYKWGIRYWCFDDGLVVDAYDECNGIVTRNKILAKGFDDMTYEELVCACMDKYNIVVYVDDKADELLYQLCIKEA